MHIHNIASSSSSFKTKDAAIKVIARRLYGAKQRCGPNAKSADKRHYHNIAFEFANVTDGAAALFAKLGPLKPGHSIDRIDPRGPYSLDNIRWADATAQTANRIIASLERKRRLAARRPGVSSGTDAARGPN